MRKIKLIVILLLICLLINSCGNLLEMLAVGVTYEQKMRGIWIVGGLSTASINSTVAQLDLYDPVTGRWFANVASTVGYTPVSFAGIASCNGKIYVIGGFDSGGICLNSTQMYDVATDTWTLGLENMPANRANIDAETIYDKIYIAGGSSANANIAYNDTNEIYAYDTIQDDWGPPVACYSAAHFSCYALNNIYYYLGGRITANSVLQNHYSYETSTGFVVGKLGINLIPPRAGMAAAVYNPSDTDPILIIIGGFQNLTGFGNYSYIFNGNINQNLVPDVWYVLYPFSTNNSWSSVADYPDSLAFISAAVYNDTLYCFGGTDASGSNSVFNNVYSLDLTDIGGSSWQAETNMEVARFGHTALTINQ